MPLSFTLGRLDKIRDTVPGKPGPLTKIANFEDNLLESSVVDHVRRVRFVKALQTELVEYSKAMATIAQKYGESQQGGAFFTIKPEKQAEFAAEKEKLDAETRELLINPLPVSAYEKIPLTAFDLIGLEPFVVMPEDKDA
jgi:hypothetical protein